MFIINEENEYLPAIDFNEGHRLRAVFYINSNDESLVLLYGTSLYLLMLKNYHLKLWSGKNALQNKLHLFPSFLGDIYDVNISSSQHLIAVTTYKVC